MNGTSISISKYGNDKEEYKKIPSSAYINALLGGIYDISNELILDLLMDPGKCERKKFINQLSFIKENDIIICDRGYYSLDFFI